MIVIHTYFKRGFESFVGGRDVVVTLKMHPHLVTSALNRAGLVSTTYGFGENWSLHSSKTYLRKSRVESDCFSHLQIVHRLKKGVSVSVFVTVI